MPGTWRAAADASAPETVPQVLVAACATGLALSLAWLWVVTSVTVAEVVTGSVPRRGGATRRLVLLACGAAVVAGTALPAHASGGDGAEVLVGLPLPERAVAPATSGRPARAPVALDRRAGRRRLRGPVRRLAVVHRPGAPGTGRPTSRPGGGRSGATTATSWATTPT